MLPSSPVFSAVLCEQASFRNPAGRDGMQLFSKHILPGTGFSAAVYREAFHGLGSSLLHKVQFWLILYVLLIKKEKKKGKNGHGPFFPGHWLSMK
jgi:hypothetical protein